MAATHPELVTVFGGSGFIGRHVVRMLARRGYRVRVAVRRPDLGGFLVPYGAVGQVHLVQANLRFPQSVRAACDGAAAVVNCVGILTESGRQSFNAIHAEGARTVAEAASAVGAKLVHLSALGAALDSLSVYAKSKAEGENAVMSASPSATILRPSVVFGPEDDFFNRFAALAQFSPALPLIGGGESKFQPVYVGDVAEAVALTVDGKAKAGIYELGGPNVLTLKQVYEAVLAATGRKRFLVPAPSGLMRLAAKVLQYVPGTPITPDQVRLLGYDNVVSDAAKAEGRTLEGLGIEPTAVQGQLGGYLEHFREKGQFTDLARTA